MTTSVSSVLGASAFLSPPIRAGSVGKSANTLSQTGRSTSTLPKPTRDFLAGAALKLSTSAAPLAGQNAAIEHERTALSKAAEALRAGDNQTARNIALKFQKENPQSGSAAHIVGRSYLAEGNYVEAEKHLQRAASLAPTVESIQTDLSNARLLQNPDEQVAKVADRLLASPASASNGLRLYFSLIERSPENARVHLRLADALDKAGAPAAALGGFESALNHGDDETLVRLEDRLKRFVTDHPEAGVGFDLLGRTRLKRGNVDDALRAFDQALSVAPGHKKYTADKADAFAAKAAKQLDRNDPAAALRFLDLAQTLDPARDDKEDRAAAHLKLGEKLLARGSQKQAFDNLNTARSLTENVDTKTELAAAFFSLGRKYQTDNDLTNAQLNFKYAHTLNDNQPTYKVQYAEVTDQIGLQQQTAGKITTAVASFQTAVTLFPSHTTYKNHLAAAQALQSS